MNNQKILKYLQKEMDKQDDIIGQATVRIQQLDLARMNLEEYDKGSLTSVDRMQTEDPSPPVAKRKKFRGKKKPCPVCKKPLSNKGYKSHIHYKHPEYEKVGDWKETFGKAPLPEGKKKRSFNGKHWTQLPKNKAKVLAWRKKVEKAKAAKHSFELKKAA